MNNILLTTCYLALEMTIHKIDHDAITDMKVDLNLDRLIS